MQSSSIKLSTLLTIKCICKQKIYIRKNAFTNAEINDSSAVRYGVKSVRFQSQFEASCMSIHTDEFWYNETV